MYRMLIAAPLLALVLAACVVSPAHRGAGHHSGVVVAPALPFVVEIGVEPFYFHGGYHYHYHNDRWSYSQSRSGPWIDLPRSHYPKEIRRSGARHDGRIHDHDGRANDRHNRH